MDTDKIKEIERVEKDNTVVIFKKILEYLYNRYNNPEIRNKVQTCIIHPHEYSYTLGIFYNKLRGFNPATEWSNVFYLYPNKDNVYNTNNNVLVDNEKDLLYTIRLDHRLGYMAVMSLLKVLMLDFDLKDYDVSSKEELKQKTLETFKNINIFLKSENEQPLVWYMSETDNGFHFFLINKYIDYKEKDNIFQRFLTIICGDMDYAAFSIFNGFCVRLSKKLNRENDYVAKHKEIKIPALSLNKVFDTSTLIYDNEEDLKTIKDGILKTLNVKYRLIKYFIQFSTKHFEYILYNFNSKKVLSIIREHLELTICSTDNLFDEMKNSFGIFEKNPSNIIRFITKVNDNDVNDFELIDKIVNPTVSNGRPLITALNYKYLKYKQKYIELKKMQNKIKNID
jgi:hypothetical protein